MRNSRSLLGLVLPWCLGLALCKGAASAESESAAQSTPTVTYSEFIAGSRVCTSSPTDFFRTNRNLTAIFICQSSDQFELCSARDANRNKDCEEIRLNEAMQNLGNRAKILGSTSDAASRAFLKDQSIPKRVFASFWSLLKVKAQFFVKPNLEIQTGPYPQVSTSLEALNSKCMATIVQSAYRLHREFPNYTFVVNSHIQNCENLKEGVKQLIAEKSRVMKNVDHFNSPLHSIYLTNTTKFIDNEIGKMGLYVDVNRPREIQRRLIDFDVSGIIRDRRLSQL